MMRVSCCSTDARLRPKKKASTPGASDGAAGIAGVGAVSPNGVLGDPSGATAGEGASVLRSMVDEVVRRIDVVAR